MIRHVVMMRFGPSATGEQIERATTELAELDFPDRLGFTVGPDLGLREGNMDLVLFADFADVDAFSAYDALPEHNRIRRELLAPIVAQVERCQFEM